MDITGRKFSAVIAPHGWECEVSDSLPLLKAASLSGITLPSSCRNGTCRACICRLVSGQIGYRIEWPGVSREEKAEGWILPCVAYPESDVVIEVPLAAKQG